MLREIHIRNYAVVDNLTLEFFPGLNLITGETGSGKSILVDALGLVLGGRASPDLIRTGQDRATVSAVFQAESSAPWDEWLDEHGLGGEGETEILLRREVQSGGKSRLLVNDQPVTLSAVRSLAPRLVDIHGQNEHVALLGRDVQIELLDQFAESQDLLDQVGQLFRERNQLEREMDELSRNEQERLRTIDVLRYQVEELERAYLEPGEDARLENERRLLSNVERLRGAASTAFANLYDDEGSACSRLALVEKSLEDLCRYDPSAQPYFEPLASARIALEDLATYFRQYLGKLDSDPTRLEQVEDRLAHLDRLKRKYGKSIEEILTYRERTIEQLHRLEHADERSAELASKLEFISAEYQGVARLLSEKRRRAAQPLEKKVTQELAQLGMEKARFQVFFLNVQQGVGGLRGIDEIELRISPNPGEELRPLDKIASGGELSRLMLALKTVVAEHFAEGPEPDQQAGSGNRSAAKQRTREHGPTSDVTGWTRTFVFDEVDAGIGGRVAECVGQRLKKLARNAQVLCVTHLPQIACFADHHFHVEKIESQGRTVAQLQYLATDKARAAELARMLSGSQITDAVLKHASAMLRQAAGRHQFGV
jgi:DNA repair protein RecN (Recombination protein N)